MERPVAKRADLHRYVDGLITTQERGTEALSELESLLVSLEQRPLAESIRATNLTAASPDVWFRALKRAIARTDASLDEQLAVVERLPAGPVRPNGFDPWAVSHDHCLTEVIRQQLRGGTDPQSLTDVTELFRSDAAYQGHRLLLQAFAERGDLAGFTRQWPQVQATKQRQIVAMAKATLVHQVADREGLEAGLALTRKSRFAGLEADAVAGHLAGVDYDRIRQFENARPDLARSDAYVITDALVARYSGDADAAEKERILPDAFDRLARHDPKDKRGGDYSWRDWQLMVLWDNSEDPEWKKRLRKEIRSTAVKREMGSARAT